MKTFYTLLITGIALPGFSQQLPLFTQYLEYAGIVNPASVPTDFLWFDKKLSFGGSYRRQWINDEDGPATIVARGDYVWENRNRTTTPILGGYFMHDKVGRVGTTGFYLRAAGLISDEPDRYGISVGLAAGGVYYALDLNDARLHDPDDILALENYNQFFPDVGLGVHGYTTIYDNHVIYAGLSMPQAFGLDVRFRNEKGDLSVQRVRHLYGTVGYHIDTGDSPNETFYEFYSWLRYVKPVGISYDVNFRWKCTENFFFGAGAGNSGNIHSEFGLWLEGENDYGYRIGFGADLPIFSEVSSYYGTSIEFNFACGID